MFRMDSLDSLDSLSVAIAASSRGGTMTAEPSSAAALRLGRPRPPEIFPWGITMTDPRDHVADQLITIDSSKCSGWAGPTPARR